MGLLAKVLTPMDRLERPDLYVLVRLLETLRTTDRQLTRTQLQVAAGMNYTQFDRYLELSISRGFVVLNTRLEGPPWVSLTPKGYDALMFLARGIREVLGADLLSGRWKR
jgi:predicted transcriptional regulator